LPNREVKENANKWDCKGVSPFVGVWGRAPSRRGGLGEKSPSERKSDVVGPRINTL